MRIVADGKYGVFEGSARDRVVMAEYQRTGSWAEDLVTLIVKRLFAGRAGTFIDVGANIGLVSIPVVERSGALGIGFEPEPENYGFFRANVQRHQLADRIECHACACHAADGEMALSLSPDNLGDHRLQREPAAQGRQSIRVPTRRLDDVLRGRALPEPIVLKLDAQGSEVSVFAGARETLARAEHLVTEYWPAGIVAHGDDAEGFRQSVLGFPFGAVLHVLPLPEPLYTSRYVFEQLSWIKHDGSDPGFFDLLFSRVQHLPL
jgi:FkbM family methyltransferase